MKGVGKVLLTITIVSICLNFYALGAETTLEEKQLKLKGCIALSRNRMMEDKEFVIEIERAMGGGDSSQDKIGNRIMSLMLLSCYNNISVKQGKDLTESKGKFNAKSEENLKLLGLEGWYKLFQEGDEDKVKGEMQGLQSAIQEIQANKLFDSVAGGSGGDEGGSEDDEYRRQEAAARRKRSQSEEYERMQYKGKGILHSLIGVSFGELDMITQNLIILLGVLLVILFMVYVYNSMRSTCKPRRKKKRTEEGAKDAPNSKDNKEE